MNKIERAQLQRILVKYIENPRKMGGCILDIEELFRTVHTRWTGFSRNKVGGVDMAEEIVQEIIDKCGISIKTFLGPARSGRVLKARSEIVLALYEIGFSQSEIARAINKHPSTVLYILRKSRIK